MTHKELVLDLAAKLPIEENFEVPDGLLIPAGSQVLVKRVKQPSYLMRGSIYIPTESDKVKGFYGVVMAVGPTVDLEAYPIRPGVKIEFRQGLEEDTIHGNEKYILMDTFNIKGLVPEGNFKFPKYPTTEEIRREERMETTKRIHQLGEAKLDEIKNG